MAFHSSAEIDAVAQVYAQSLFDLADEAGGTDKISELQEQLTDFVALVRDEPELGAFLDSRIISAQHKTESMQRMFGEGRIDDLLLRFLLVLNKKERLGHLPAIAAAFSRLHAERIGRIDVAVYTAEKATEEQLESIREKIRDTMGKDPILTNHVDPSVIGGIRLRIGDRLIDATVASRLRQIRARLRRAGTEAIAARLDSMLGEGDSGSGGASEEPITV
ncbi:MAG: ATP synthase F1 subunit delta [Planctomycetota bacterium]